ncbi:hypothetical protein P7C70_g9462, partial [Phenoliferia sp. Uapishka_3]
MELNGLAEGFTSPGVKDFPNPDRPFFHSRMGGYVVIPTDKYDELLDAQHCGLEAERLAADTIETLERWKQSHASQRSQRTEEGISHETPFLNSISAAATTSSPGRSPLIISQPSFVDSVFERLRVATASANGSDNTIKDARNRTPFLATFLVFLGDAVDVNTTYLHAHLPEILALGREEETALMVRSNFSSHTDARAFYFPMGQTHSTAMAGDNIIQATALNTRVDTKIVLDTGCSRDLTDNKSLLRDYVAYTMANRVRINGAGGGMCFAEGAGTLVLTTTLPDGKTGIFVRKNVLFAPSLGHTLISTSSMMRSGWTFTNTTTTLHVVNPAGVLVGLGQIGIQAICLM